MIKSTCPTCGMIYQGDAPVQCPCLKAYNPYPFYPINYRCGACGAWITYTATHYCHPIRAFSPTTIKPYVVTSGDMN